MLAHYVYVVSQKIARSVWIVLWWSSTPLYVLATGGHSNHRIIDAASSRNWTRWHLLAMGGKYIHWAMRVCVCSTLKTWAWWRIGRNDAFRPESRVLESRSSRHVGTLGKSFTYSCL